MAAILKIIQSEHAHVVALGEGNKMRNSKGLPSKRRNRVVKESIYNAEPEYLENKTYWGAVLIFVSVIVAIVIAVITISRGV